MPPQVVVPLEYAVPSGGMLHSVELLIRHLNDLMHCVVVAPEASATSQRMSAAGATVVETRGLPKWTLSRRAPLRTLESVVAVRRALRGVLDSESVLLTNGMGAELIAGLGSPCSIAPRIYVNRGNEYRGTSLRLLRRSLTDVRRVVATTRYQRQVVVEQMGVPAERISIIPNAVDEALLEVPDTPPPAWRIPNAINVGVVGFPSPGKNQELLIRAIAKLRAERATFIGHIVGSPGSDGDRRYLAYLKALVHELKLSDKIQFIPYQSDKRLLYSAIDILVSTSRREGFGRTIIEAMAASRPVVALKAGGPECIISAGETGLLLEHNDPELLAEALLKVASDREATAAIVARARELVIKRYLPQRVARQFATLINAVLAGERDVLVEDKHFHGAMTSGRKGSC